MRKYGVENFDFSIIEECEEPYLDEREAYWIKYYNSHNKEKGYNLTDGGTNPPFTGKKVNQYDLDGNYIQSFESAAEAARYYNVIAATITSCCYGIKSNPTACGYLWRFDYQEPPKPYIRKANRYDIEEYDLNDNFLRSFSSLKELARTINTTDVTLRKHFKKYGDTIKFNGRKYIRKARR